MEEQKRISTEELNLLKKAIEVSVSRYEWGKYSNTFNFQNDNWDIDSVTEDIQTNSQIRKNFSNFTLHSKKIESDPENLKLFVEVARLVYQRYTWPKEHLVIYFPEGLGGTLDEIVNTLDHDYWVIYNYRKRAKKNPESLDGCSVNIRVMTTIEGLIFQALRSLKPFTGAKSSGPGHIRYMRCLEGLLFQAAKILNSDFTTKKEK
jgi:hypothetical protein